MRKKIKLFSVFFLMLISLAKAQETRIQKRIEQIEALGMVKSDEGYVLNNLILSFEQIEKKSNKDWAYAISEIKNSINTETKTEREEVK